jgi:hypothetical protein
MRDVKLVDISGIKRGNILKDETMRLPPSVNTRTLETYIKNVLSSLFAV